MIPAAPLDAAGRLLAEPIRHLYALLWRAGILTTDKDDQKCQ